MLNTCPHCGASVHECPACGEEEYQPSPPYYPYIQYYPSYPNYYWWSSDSTGYLNPQNQTVCIGEKK